MIDRADYMTLGDSEDDRLEAYEDHAWRRGTLHLSAPCIYTRALEALKLERGILYIQHIIAAANVFTVAYHYPCLVCRDLVSPLIVSHNH